jgi:hypothetical protein
VGRKRLDKTFSLVEQPQRLNGYDKWRKMSSAGQMHLIKYIEDIPSSPQMATHCLNLPVSYVARAAKQEVINDCVPMPAS